MLILDDHNPWVPAMRKVEWPASKIPPGWLPAAVSGGRAVIRWIYVGREPLAEAFLPETVRRLRASEPPAVECETEVSVLERRPGEPSSAPPAGIIFHMTRCGSTLLANALRRADEAVVVSESAAVARAMEWIGSPSSYWAGIGARLIESLTAVFANYQAHGKAGRVVIKCSSQEIRCLRELRAVWPRVPCLILIRNPIEVLVSNALKPSKLFLDWQDHPRVVPLGVPPAEVFDGGVVEFSAWMAGRFCSTALAVLDAGCWVLDYAQITPEVAKKVARYFGLSLSDEGEQALTEVFQFHSKRPDRAFIEDSTDKIGSAAEHMKMCAARWIQAPYDELRSQSRTPELV